MHAYSVPNQVHRKATRKGFQFTASPCSVVATFPADILNSGFRAWFRTSCVLFVAQYHRPVLGSALLILGDSSLVLFTIALVYPKIQAHIANTVCTSTRTRHVCAHCRLSSTIFESVAATAPSMANSFCWIGHRYHRRPLEGRVYLTTLP